MPRPRNNSPLFILVAIIAVVAALYVAKEILLPLALAVMLSFLITPLANRIERLGVPRVPTVILVVAMSFTVLGVLGWVVTDQVIDLSRNLETYKRNVITKIRDIRPSSNTLGQFTKALEEVGKELSGTANEKSATEDGKTTREAEPQAQSPRDNAYDWLPLFREDVPAEQDEKAVEVRVVEMPPSPLAQMQNWLGPLVAPLTTTGIVIVLVFFLLLDRENQRNRLIQLFGTSNLRTTTEALHDTAQRVGRYLRMQFLINAGYGVAVGVGLWLIGVPSAVMWGVLGFALRFLPYLGPWLAAVLPILVSLADSEGWTKPLLVVGMYVVYELVLNNLAEPLLYGSSIGVSTVGVIIAAIFWTWLWGPIGLILAMPMTVCLVVMARYVPQLRFLTVFLADQPPLSPAQRMYQRLLAFDDNEPRQMAHTHLKSSTLASFYDEVLIPALTLAEQDRHADLLNEDQEAFVQETAEDLVEELTEAAVKAGPSTTDSPDTDDSPGEDKPATRILCIPLRDEADETTARMLAQLLSAEGFRVETSAAGSLTSELVDRVANLESEIAVISVLPPIRPRDSRLLWKRLRERYPELPIIVGYWLGAGQQASLAQPLRDEASKVVTTLADAVAMVRSTAAQVRLTAQEPKPMDAAG